MTAPADDALITEMIGLLRDIKGSQDTQASKLTAVERAVMTLAGSVAALEDRRLSAIVSAIWGMVVAIVIAGGLVAGAIVWG